MLRMDKIRPRRANVDLACLSAEQRFSTARQLWLVLSTAGKIRSGIIAQSLEREIYVDFCIHLSQSIYVPLRCPDRQLPWSFVWSR